MYLTSLCNLSDVQVECIKRVDHYIPPLWIMCLESVAHLLVMFNFSSNFLIYCSVSNQFKAALSKVCHLLCRRRVGVELPAHSDYYSVGTNTGAAADRPHDHRSDMRAMFVNVERCCTIF